MSNSSLFDLMKHISAAHPAVVAYLQYDEAAGGMFLELAQEAYWIQQERTGRATLAMVALEKDSSANYTPSKLDAVLAARKQAIASNRSEEFYLIDRGGDREAAVLTDRADESLV